MLLKELHLNNTNNHYRLLLKWTHSNNFTLPISSCRIWNNKRTKSPCKLKLKCSLRLHSLLSLCNQLEIFNSLTITSICHSTHHNISKFSTVGRAAALLILLLDRATVELILINHNSNLHQGEHLASSTHNLPAAISSD